MANSEDGKCTFDSPLIFLSNLAIRNFSEILPMMEHAASKNLPLVIFCKGMEGNAMNNVVMNLLQKTIEVAIITAPNFGDAQLDELGDIQSLLGGKVFVEESKDDITLFTETDLGTCSKVIITKETTTFIGGEGDTSLRITSLKETAEETKGHELARLKARIARLKGGVATIKIGASSSIEMREKKERLDDALNATKAALEEGIVVGGGNPFVRFRETYSAELPNWFRLSLTAPIDTLLENSDERQRFQPNKIYAEGKADWGYNALKGVFEDLGKAGVYDPVKVTKNSFLAAMSIASLFYSTDVAVLLEE